MKPEPCLVSPARLKRGGVARARSTSALDATIDPLCSSSSSMPDELLSYFISAATRFHITLSTRRFLHRGYFLPAGSDLPSSTRHLFRWTVRHSWPCGGRHRALSGVSQAVGHLGFLFTFDTSCDILVKLSWAAVAGSVSYVLLSHNPILSCALVLHGPPFTSCQVGGP